MSFPNPPVILTRPRKTFAERRPSVVESALVVLLVGVANAVSLAVTSGAFLDAEWAA